MRGRWPDFLLTVVIRLVVGGFIGLAIALPVLLLGGARQRRRSVLVDAMESGNTGLILQTLVLFGLVGGVVAVLCIPRWQTPWYRGRRPWED